jgi:hypothetical protein
MFHVRKLYKVLRTLAPPPHPLGEETAEGETINTVHVVPYTGIKFGVGNTSIGCSYC